ncbi:MAG: PAS domain-containing protein [Deltaproteobacteria bacterium]|nr:PAS domain-containing protein [Deltaproteobacteria bacterium]
MIHFINDYGAHFFGFGADELLGRDVTTTIMQDEEAGEQGAASSEQRMAEVRANPDLCLPSEMAHRHVDGRKVWVAWSNRPVLDRRGYLVEVLACSLWARTSRSAKSSRPS